MDFKLKNWIMKHFNAYFLFVAMAFTIGAYVFFMDNAASYVIQSDVLILARNEKTAINIDRIRENLISLAQKSEVIGEDVKVKVDKKNSLIEFEIAGDNQVKVSERSDLLMRNFIDYAGKYYDAKDDLELEIVTKQTFKKEANRFFMLANSILIGLVLSFIVQAFLDLVERLITSSVLNNKKPKRENRGSSNDLENVLRINSDKIRRLSFSKPVEDENWRNQISPRYEDTQKIVPKKEEIRFNNEVETSRVVFKKASSPANLPIATEDSIIPKRNDTIENIPAGIPFIDEEAVKTLEEKVFGNISHVDHEHDLVFAKENTLIEKDIQIEKVEEKAIETEKKFVEPTEEDFKKKLNQLLGNR